MAVLLTGIGAGIAGALLTLLLHLVQYTAYGYADEAFVLGSRQASGLRRFLAMTAGGLLVGLGWWALRRWSRGRTSVTDGVADPARRPQLPTSSIDAVLQIVAVGCGASLGREGAPRQVAAALAGWLAERTGLEPARQRTLIACGAGAGLAAVYNVPLGGALFALEAILASAARSDVLIALVTSVVATIVAWPVVGSVPTFDVPAFDLTTSSSVGALLLGPLPCASG